MGAPVRLRGRPRALAGPIASALLAFACPATAIAAPHQLTHQGRLFDAAGAPVDGPLSVTFAIYDAQASATPLWTETHMVTFDDGYYSVALGATSPLDAALDGSERFLGIQVGADPEMTPRAAIDSVPYVFEANDAVGDITPASVSVAGAVVIDASGGWVGDPSGLKGNPGPMGIKGPSGPAGATGPTGAKGPTGVSGAAGSTGPIGPMGAAGPTGMTGPMGNAGPNGAIGIIGPMGSTGPQGPQGPMGTAGAMGPAALVRTAYASGTTTAPVDSLLGNFSFISAPVSVVTTGFGNFIEVRAEASLGSTTAGGANNLTLSICRQDAGMGALIELSNYIGDLRVAQNTRVPFALVARFALPAGTYSFGLCGFTSVTGEGAKWNNNDRSRTTVVVSNL
ncbi:MAG: collagen-like protein [Polyangiaceae bacterium]